MRLPVRDAPLTETQSPALGVRTGRRMLGETFPHSQAGFISSSSLNAERPFSATEDETVGPQQATGRPIRPHRIHLPTIHVFADHSRIPVGILPIDPPNPRPPSKQTSAYDLVVLPTWRMVRLLHRRSHAQPASSPIAIVTNITIYARVTFDIGLRKSEGGDWGEKHRVVSPVWGCGGLAPNLVHTRFRGQPSPTSSIQAPCGEAERRRGREQVDRGRGQRPCVRLRPRCGEELWGIV